MEAFPIQKIHHLAIDEWDIVILIVTQTSNPFYGLTKGNKRHPTIQWKKIVAALTRSRQLIPS